MTCCFFGHRDTPEIVSEKLNSTIIDLIENKNVTHFLVGNQGNFDIMARNALKNIKEDYPHIQYEIVLAYLPSSKPNDNSFDYSVTIYPDGLEKTPRRFAISHRNKWMVKNSDYVIAYVVHTVGGAAQFVEYARKQGKEIINLSV